MAWTLEFDAQARKQLRKLTRAAAERILDRIEAIAAEDNPRVKGIAMTGTYAGYWRYRVGYFRVIVKIEQDRLMIVVIAIGHRRGVYR